MELPEYEFFCHAQIVTELNRYNADAPIWLSEKVGAQKIKSYTDQEILESLSLVRGPLACATYTQMLKLACDAFSRNYFSEHYRALEDADYATISNEDYLKELERLDIEVGKKNNLGEIKSFVLLQVLSVMLGEQIYVFCSDDKNARNGATNFEDVRCISLVSVFSRLKEESNWTLADAEADAHLCRYSRADVGLERLSAALSRARPHEVYDHPHPRAVSQGQLWYR